MLPSKNEVEIPIIQTTATQKQGVRELTEKLIQFNHQQKAGHKKDLLIEKAYQLIMHKRMKDVSKLQLAQQIRERLQENDFNLYRFVSAY
jgi:LAO/AO transport system kinase